MLRADTIARHSSYVLAIGWPFAARLLLSAAALLVLACGGPTEAERQYQTAAELQAQERWREALEAYNEVVRLDPENAEAHYNRGLVHSGLGETESAIEDLRETLRLDPNHVPALTKRGELFWTLEEYDKAAHDLDRAIRLDSNADTYEARARVSAAQGNHSRAKRELSTAIRLEPDRATAYLTRGIAYFGLGEIQNAVDDFNDAIRLSPESANAYANRALANTLLGNDNEASKDIDRAVQLGVDGVELREGIDRAKAERDPGG